MMTLRKFQIGSTNGKCPLILLNLIQEVIFSRITQKVIHPTAILNNMPIVCSSCQKHLCIHLDEKLKFSNHIKEKFRKQTKV